MFTAIRKLNFYFEIAFVHLDHYTGLATVCPEHHHDLAAHLRYHLRT